jgi:outer membrane lipoprotein SlyB
MSVTVEQTQTPTFNTKPLWAAVGVLSVSVLALGGALVHVKTKPVEPMITELAEPAKLAALSAPAGAAAQLAPTDEVKTVVVQPKPVVKAQPKPAPRAVAHAPSAAPAPAYGGGSGVAQAPLPTQRVVQREICATCGTVESVNAVTRQGEANGIGAVGGAVLGGVVGHQVGGGRGKDVATVLGAVGGGLLGHQVEKNVKKTTVYQVRVRMEDGSTRTVEQASAPAVGAKVTVDGNKLHSADSGNPAPAPQQQAAQPVMVQNRY